MILKSGVWCEEQPMVADVPMQAAQAGQLVAVAFAASMSHVTMRFLSFLT